MNNKKSLLTIFLSAMVLLTVALGLVACRPKEEETPVDYGEEGVYSYFTEEPSVEYLLTLNSNSFTLNLVNETKKGVYEYDGTTLKFKFEDATDYSPAALDGDRLTLTYGDFTYTFVKRTLFKVTLSVDDAQEVSYVYNGKGATEPQSPQKEGYTFIAWYEDSSFSGKPYSFEGQPLTADLTLYARFIKNETGEREYKANLIVNGTEVAVVETVNGILYNLPDAEGTGFLGWWTSDFQSADKLTAKYDGQKLAADTKLFAVYESDTPAVSVTASGVKWSTKSFVGQYAVKVTSPGGAEETKNSGQTTYTYDFANKAAGEYVIEITAGSKVGKAYYINKALDRVSQFSVLEPSILLFNKVDNAQKYIITVQSGDGQIVEYDNGDNATFNFDDIQMTKGGITFVVTAKAENFADSVSDKFVYDRSLSAVTEIAYVQSEGKVVWNAVENATSYKVVVKTGDNEYSYTVDYANSFSVKEFSGEITVRVTPATKGYNSPDAASVSFSKATVGVPANIRVEGTKLKWDAVLNATGYNVKIGTTVIPVTGVELELISSYFTDGKSDYEISVQALTGSAETNSLYSDALTVKYQAKPGRVAYSNGVVSWQPVIGASAYGVRVNGGTVMKVNANSVKKSVTLTKAGTNKIEVCYYDSLNQSSEWSEYNVWAASIYYDVNGGDIMDSPRRYYAIGDTVVLPVPTRDGYSFTGWYNIPSVSQGIGQQYLGGSFDSFGDKILFASWEANPVAVSLVVGESGVAFENGEDSQGLIYKEKYSLPVPEVADGRMVFVGWYTEPAEAGIQFTDANGDSFSVWSDLTPRTLYAGWREAFSFNLVTNDTEYSVSKGSEIGYVSSIKIPATYNGKPVTIINSFQSSYNLVSIDIPDTITTVEDTAFKYCSKLIDVNVYHVDGNREIIYESLDGVLVQNKNGISKELKFIPGGRKGAIVIPDGVTDIPMNALKGSYYMTSLTIPASVTTIGEAAFYGSSALTTVTFLPAADGVEQPLTIGTMAFQNCSKLVNVTLPGRLQTVDDFDTMFFNCYDLAYINIEGQGSVYSSKDGVICSADGTTILYAARGRSGEYVIPDGVKAVADNAFNGRSRITKLTVPAFVQNIGISAFSGVTGLKQIVFEGDRTSPTLTIGESAFYNNYYLTSVTLPANLKTLGAYAFGNISSLKRVTVDSGVFDEVDQPLNFAAKAFSSTSGSSYVQELILGEFVPNLEINSIFGGSALATVEVNENNQFYTAVDGVLFNKDVTEILYYPLGKVGSEYSIPESVTKIGSSVFKSITSLNKIIIGKNVVSIGAEAFASCSKLSEVVFVTGGTEKLEIGAKAFRQTTALTSIDLPARLEKIGESAFEFSGLINLVIPEGVKIIENSAFASSKLETISIPSTVEKMGGYDASGNLTSLLVFNLNSNLTQITVAAENTVFASADGVLFGKKDGVISEVYFSPLNKTGSVNLPATITKIWDKAFYNNKLLTTVTFNDGLTGELVIGKEAFSGCIALESVDIPEGTVTISEKAFYGCSELTAVTIPSTVSLIDKSAFYNAKKLESVTFTDGEVPLTIGNGSSSTNAAFGATVLSEVVLPERTSVLSDYTFYGITTLTSVTLPYKLTTLAKSLFENCTSLSTVIFAAEGNTSQLSTIGEKAFKATALTEIEFPATVSNIGKESFYGTQISELEIPEKVSVIGDNAFAYMSNLSSVKFADNIAIKSLGTGIFRNAGLLVSVKVPASVTSLGTYVFAYSPNLETVELSENLKTIGSSAFVSSYALNNIVLPDKLETIGSSAFRYTALTSINIPASVTKIDSYAFSSSDLISVTFASGSKLKTIGNGAFGYTNLTSFEFPVATGALTLGSELFDGCTKLTTIRLTKSVTDITGVFTDNIYIQEFTVDADNEHFTADTDFPILYNKEGNAIRLVFQPIMFETGEDNVYTIPDNIEEIGYRAFDRQTYIKKLIIPASVKKIGDYAFKDLVNLETVEFAANSNLESIGMYAFVNCVSLKSISIPEGVKEIGNSAFDECISLTNVELPATITTIGYSAFENCVSLKSITLPEGLEKIDYYAFRYSGLESVTIPSTVTIINSDAFRFTSLQSIKIKSAADVTFGSYAFGDNTQLTEVIFEGDGLKNIGSYMFTNDTALASVTLPESLEVISSYAFQNTGLVSITIPANVKRIALPSSSTAEAASYAFDNCLYLETVTFASNGNLERIGQYAFKNTPVLGAVEIPSTVAFIDAYAFYGSGITSVKLPDALFGSSLFYGATRLESVEFDANTTTFSSYSMFSGTTALKNIDLPASLTDLGSSTFQGSGLESIVIPDGVKIIKSSAFNGCESLASVELNEFIEEIQYGAFRATKSLTSITLPDKLSIIGNTIFQESGLVSIVIPGKLRQIGNYTFDGCADLESVDILGATTIGSYAFRNCVSLKNIEMSQNITSIGDYAFANCGLEEVYIPDNVTTIGKAAFAGCKSLEAFEVSEDNLSFEVRNGILYGKDNTLISYPAGKEGRVVIEEGTQIGQYAFSGVDKPLEIVIPGTDITNYAFNGFEGLVSLVVPEGVTSIGNYAFENAVNLQSISLPSTLTYIGSNAFKGAASLTTIEWPNGSNLQEIGTGAFREATSLETFTMPESLVTIGTYAFYGCSSLGTVIWPTSGNLVKLGGYSFEYTALTTVELPASITEVAATTFAYIPTLTTVILHDGITTIGTTAFGYNPLLSSVTLPASLDKISASVFKNTPMLKSLSLPSSITEIGSSAFEESGIESITIPASVTKIGASAFKNSGLKTIVFDENENADILNSASIFEGAASLSSVTLPSSIYNIGASLFRGTKSLKQIDLPSSMKINVTSTFRESGLVSIVVPAGFTVLGTNAFEDCVDLKTVVISEGITTINERAFANCTSLESVTLPSTLSRIGSSSSALTGSVFENCTSISEIVIPASCTSVYAYSFLGWTSQQTIKVEAAEYMVTGFWASAWSAMSDAKVVWSYVA